MPELQREDGLQLHELPALTTAVGSDLIGIRDVSDLTDGANGTDKYITAENLKVYFNPSYYTDITDLGNSTDINITFDAKHLSVFKANLTGDGTLTTSPPQQGYCSAHILLSGSGTLTLPEGVIWLTTPITINPDGNELILDVYSADTVLYVRAKLLIDDKPLEYTRGPHNLGMDTDLVITLGGYYEIFYSADMVADSTLTINAPSVGCYVATLLITGHHTCLPTQNVIWIGETTEIVPTTDLITHVKIIVIDGVIYLEVYKQNQSELTLADVAVTGSYDDLLDKPNIPVSTEPDLGIPNAAGQVLASDLQGNRYWKNIDTSIVYINNTPPNNPINGSLWWNPGDGSLYIYYDDGDSEQWVVSSPVLRGPPGRNGTIEPLFKVDGVLQVNTGTYRWYVEEDRTISDINVWVSTPPQGAPIIVDVNKNGSTIFTTQNNRPRISIGAYTVFSCIPDIVAVTQGDYFTYDIDQVGSTTPGSNAVIHIKYL